jgi:hypothetical protein
MNLETLEQRIARIEQTLIKLGVLEEAGYEVLIWTNMEGDIHLPISASRPGLELASLHH